MTRIKRFSSGPKPTTERGKRRHAARQDGQKRHAEKVWDGGYVVKPKEVKRETDS